MRVQFIPFAAPSHITLMVPLAWALQTAGHEVRMAVPPNFVDTVARTGLLAVPFGVDVELEDADEIQPDDAAELAELSGLECDGSLRDQKIRGELMGVLAAYFAFEVLQPTTTELIELTKVWQPDLVVWDALCFHGSAAAVVSGAASARLITGIDHSARMRADWLKNPGDDQVAELVNGILQRYGHSFSERIVLGDWTINPLPVIVPNRPELDSVTVRQIAFSHVTEAPAWVFEPPQRPRVCLTLGRTVRDTRGNDNFGISVPDLFTAVADLDVEVVATFTAEQLPQDVKVPDNVRLVDFVPMNLLMPTCAAVIHHSGPSTMMSAVWHQVPQVIIPPSIWDEEELAEAVAAYGAGIGIPVGELTPERLRAALVRVLDDPAFLEGARKLHAATLCAPGPNEVVPMLERFTRAAAGRH